MIDHLLQDNITRASHSTDRYGDISYTAFRDVPCRFREINELSRADHREQIDSDALLHLPAGESVVLGDIFIYRGQYYKAKRILNARKFGDEVHFKKVGLQKIRQVS